MEWLLVAVLAKGIIATDMSFDSAVDCYEMAAKASANARGALAEMSEDSAQDIAISQYSCVLMDN